MNEVTIVGAGLAGLIAGCHLKNASIIDAGKRGQNHQALLRFRSTAVSEITGIPFKKVVVQKEVYIEGETLNYCPIGAANAYSRKVSGGLSSRSITNLAPDVRYIAPDDFYDQLVDRLEDRITWNCGFGSEMVAVNPGKIWLSTAPMAVAMEAAGIDKAHANFEFQKSNVTVIRVPFRIPADVYQTVYFPQMHHRLFRASITGNVLILELVDLPKDFYRGFVGQKTSPENDEWDAIELAADALGIDYEADLKCEERVVSVQKFGKIVDMPKDDREAIMYELTSRHNIFSLGRFATWRNILLDDVVNDLHKIDALMGASEYVRRLSIVSNK